MLDRVIAIAPVVFVGAAIVYLLFPGAPELQRSPAVTAPAEQNPKPIGRPVTFDEMLLHSQRKARQDDLLGAHILYQELLKHARQDKVPAPKRIQALLNTGHFYLEHEGMDETSLEQVFLDAIALIDSVPDAYYSYERAYTGIERCYLLQKDYAKAADQVRALLEYYRRTYSDQPNVAYSLEQPTARRLALYLMVAGEREEAREVYVSMREAAVARGSSGRVIDGLIAQTYDKNAQFDIEEPAPRKAVFPERSGFRLVAPPGAVRPVPDPAPSHVRAERPTGGDIQEQIRGIALEGVYLERVDVVGNDVEIEGYAADNPKVAELMRELNAAGSRAELQSVEAVDREGQQVSVFKIILKTR